MGKHTPTVVVGITGVLDLQHPFPGGVLIPRVRRHEGPVIEAIGREVVGPEQQARCVNISQTHLCQPRPGASLGHPTAQHLPGSQEGGAGAHGADQVDGQVPPPVVGQRQPGLGMLQPADVVGFPQARIHFPPYLETLPNVPAEDEHE